MKKTFAYILILFLVLGGHVPRLRADDSDIFGANVKPNVMFALTSSTALENTIKSEPYTATTTYSTPATYTSTKVYKYVNSTPACKPASKPCYLVYANTISAVSDTSAQTALTNSGYWNGS